MKETVKFVTYTVYDERSNNSWDEKIEVPYGKDPEEFIKKMIQEWNNVENARKEANSKYPASMRKFVILKEENEGPTEKQLYCELRKLNLVTIFEKGQSPYDLLKCDNCGMKIKRVTLQMPHIPCFPERTCGEHQKVYDSIEKFKVHNKKYHKCLKSLTLTNKTSSSNELEV